MMLFNSYLYIFLFLPLAAVGYHAFCRARWGQLALLWLVLASSVFYGHWSLRDLWVIYLSIAVNYGLSQVFAGWKNKLLLAAGIAFNVGMLGYFKYSDFVIRNINMTGDFGIPEQGLSLPLGISFFTFQQIAFLVDSYRNEVRERRMLPYTLFVSFFPQLIAGPIVNHREMMPQFSDSTNKGINWENISRGLYLFFLGLFKKAVIADSLAPVVSNGFGAEVPLGFVASWITALSYTFQLYFDFSGYTDMAIGSALLMNIKLPANFNSPYKALDIQDFWRRWHITLGRFLRTYLYIPLGGNRLGVLRTCCNMFITFFVCGIWHGAGWTFVVWGGMHGGALVACHLWKRYGFSLPSFLSWAGTFLFVVCGWVVFRAESFASAWSLLRGMAGFNGVVLPFALESALGGIMAHGVRFGGAVKQLAGNGVDMLVLLPVLALCFPIALVLPNSNKLCESVRPTPGYAFLAACVTVGSLVYANNRVVFLYFQF